MPKGKIQQILQEKYENKERLENHWQNFLKRETYLTYVESEQFFERLKTSLKYPRIFWIFFRTRRRIKKNKRELKNLKEIFSNYNNNFIKRRLIEYSDFFDGKDDNLKFGLDEEQRIAVIKDDKHNLVVAGAGSGKTSVITSRIAYLIRRKDKIDPKRILALAFTRNAAREMEQRIKRNYRLDVKISTFHPLGWNIIRYETNKKPNLLFDGNEHDQNLLITDIFKNLLKEKEYQDTLIKYLAYHPEQEVKEDTFEDKEEYYRYMSNKKYSTLNNIEVKSIGERDIANFFFLHNIEFEYEPLVKWVDKDEDDKEYHPDFYLPDFDIYIEHWGLNENFEVSPWFTKTSQEYLELREWKLSQFEKHQKILVETWDYERKKGILISNLKNNLIQKNGEIEFIPIPYEELVEKVYNFKEQQGEISNLIVSFIRIAKSNYLKPEKIEKRIQSGDYTEKQSVFGTLALEVFKRYQEFLKVEDKIDFNDMINLAVKFVKQNEEKYLNRYDHILIDEFQDISYQRMKLIQRFVNEKSKTKLFCVGDDWQSIYQFTGSDVRFFINFQENFPHPEITILKRNYRSSKEIVDMSNDLISNNKKQIKKIAYSVKGEGQQPIFIELGKNFSYPFRMQIPNYFNLIKTLLSNDVKPSEIMVLSRFNRPLRELEQYCGANEIPTEDKAGGVKFYSAHASKGTESTHVIIINANSGEYGFPCEIQDSSVMELAKRLVTENFFEEERRLFYVALTRSKKFLYVYSIQYENSMFLNEVSPYLMNIYIDTTEVWFLGLSDFISKYIKGISLEIPMICPRCGRLLTEREGTYGRFLGCRGFPECKYIYIFESREKYDNHLPFQPKISQLENEKRDLMNDPRFSHLFSDIGLPSIEPEQYAFKYREGIFINDIYFDFETKKAVKFRRAKDSKILWIPKQFLRKSFSKDRKIPQNIQLKFKPKDLYWK